MKPTTPILLIVLFSVLISCEKETPQLPLHHGMLKRKLYYSTIKDTIPRNIFDYEYDSKNRLIKIQANNSTELFEYNEDNQLFRKYGYRIDESGSSLSDSICYKYQNGNLISEELNYVTAIHSTSSQIIYEYENSKLIRKKEYSDHVFWRMTSYEYSGSLCIRENQYNDSIGSQMSHYRTNIYDNGKLSISSFISVQGGIFNEQPILVIYYLYDENGNLIIESAEQSMEISAWLSYFYRYEYY